MRLPIIISRFSNLLFFIQKTSQSRLASFDLQKYLDENLDISFYGGSESEIWKQISKSIGKRDAEQFKKAITYAMMELEEFNMRINLRNQSGINGPIHSSHNAHAFNSFQTRVLPALLKLRAQLEKLH